MMTKIFAKAALATAVVIGLVVSSYGCDEPTPACAAGRPDFFIQLTPVANAPAACVATGDTFGISTYSPTGSNGKQNTNIASIAIQAMALGTTVETASGEGATDPDPTHKEYGLGYFSTEAPVDQFCVVPSLTTAVQNIPAYPADPANMVDATPATSISYQWSNMRFFVTAQYLGNQMTGNLTITTDGVACPYTAVGLSPAVPCGIPDPNDPTGMNQIPDQTACAPQPNPDAGHAAGSGINQDYPTTCDPKLLFCVLTKPVPALN